MANEQAPNNNSSIAEPATPAEPTAAEILAFDPFAPPKAPAEPAGDGTPAGTEPGTPPADVKPAAAGSDPSKVAPPDGKPVTPAAGAPATPAPGKSLEELIAAQTKVIRDSMTAQPAPPAPKEPDAPPAPKFNLGIPPQILDAIRSEDPKEYAAGLSAVVNGVANAVWKESEAYVKQQISEIMQGIPRLIEAHQTVAQKQREVHDDFYGTYRVFDGNPAFIPLVQNVGQLVAREMLAAGQELEWGPAMRDAIAAKLFQQFPMLKTVHDAGYKAAPAAPAKKPQSYVAGAGARPAAQPQNEFADVLGMKH